MAITQFLGQGKVQTTEYTPMILTHLMQLCTFHEILRQSHLSLTAQIPLVSESIAAIEISLGSFFEITFVPHQESTSKIQRFHIGNLVAILSDLILTRAFFLAYPWIHNEITNKLEEE